MEFKHYYIIKKNYNGEIAYINYDKLKGYNITPKNNVRYDGIVVNKMVLVKPTFIEKIIKRKIKRRLELFLKFIIDLLDNGDPNPTDLRSALNELARYRQIIKNNYFQYLDQKYIELLMKKINILENELKVRLIIFDNEKEVEHENESKKGKSR